jgi:hypothetical protein
MLQKYRDEWFVAAEVRGIRETRIRFSFNRQTLPLKKKNVLVKTGLRHARPGNDNIAIRRTEKREIKKKIRPTVLIIVVKTCGSGVKGAYRLGRETIAYRITFGGRDLCITSCFVR